MINPKPSKILHIERSNHINKTIFTNWRFRQHKTENWYPATVPGCNFTDLMANNIINNPFHSDEESRLQWIEQHDWEYQVEFELTRNDLNADELLLRFNGLDTYCDIYVNGSLLKQTNNMFIGYELLCKKFLKPGSNTLYLLFHSPIKKTMPLHQQLGYIYPAENDKSDEKLSVFSRKAPYHFGWDWGPRFVVSGIWRHVELLPLNKARIQDVLIEQTHQCDQVQLTIESNISCTDSGHFKLLVKINGEVDSSVTKELRLNEDQTHIVKCKPIIKNPQLWWPNGMGAPYLYDIELVLFQDGQAVAANQQKIGLRTIKLINQPDEMGVSFYFEINGKNIFIKGANYIPSDSFLNRVDDLKYCKIFEDTVAANMNMLRVWGGGVYEDDRFYDLADKNGILIWQDFIFACSLYPADTAFLDNVKAEAQYNIKRLRNHACIALWCGNNEIEMGIECWEWPLKFAYSEELFNQLKVDYKRLFKELLPKLIEQLDTKRQYISSSPISFWENPEDDKIGNNHYWGVWHDELPFSTFKERVPRFMSEYGFQSFPIMPSIEKFTLTEDRHLNSSTMLTRQKHPRGNSIIEHHIRAEFIAPKDFMSFTYLSQIIQSQALRAAFSAHRSAKPFCMGTLYWQFNDCWPAISWSGIDYFGRWKALHYEAKRSFKPVVVIIEEKDNWISIRAVSDLLHSIDIKVKLILNSFDGEVLYNQDINTHLKSNDNVILTELEHRELSGLDLTNCVLCVECLEKDTQLDVTYHYFSQCKALALKQPDIKITIKEQQTRLCFELTSKTLARYVHLQLDESNNNFSDNFFDLMPNISKTVSICNSGWIKENSALILDKLLVTSLYDTYAISAKDSNLCS